MYSIRDKVRFAAVIQKIIDNPIVPPTEEEARRILCSLGILDERGNVTPAFEGIVYKA